MHVGSRVSVTYSPAALLNGPEQANQPRLSMIAAVKALEADLSPRSQVSPAQCLPLRYFERPLLLTMQSKNQHRGRQK
jgi:hypothetical protein